MSTYLGVFPWRLVGASPPGRVTGLLRRRVGGPGLADKALLSRHLGEELQAGTPGCTKCEPGNSRALVEGEGGGWRPGQVGPERKTLWTFHLD